MSRGYEHITAAEVALRNRRIAAGDRGDWRRRPRASKYRNVKTVCDGITFDSKAEANTWLQLKMRQHAGEIRNLRRQVQFPLYCPAHGAPGILAIVAKYVADFVYEDAEGLMHVIDVKGGRATKTRLYQLKRTWLELQTGIVIEEIGG